MNFQNTTLENSFKRWSVTYLKFLCFLFMKYQFELIPFKNKSSLDFHKEGKLHESNGRFVSLNNIGLEQNRICSSLKLKTNDW